MAEFNTHFASYLLFNQQQSKMNTHLHHIWHHYKERLQSVVKHTPKIYTKDANMFSQHVVCIISRSVSET